MERGLQDAFPYALFYDMGKCPGGICPSQRKPITLVGVGDNRTFSFTPDVNDTDSFYQPHSTWAFVVQQGSATGSNPGATKAYLSVTVIREEGWKDDKKG